METMTDEACRAWKAMGISKDAQIERIQAWANMLEARVAELDPEYRVYQFGRVLHKEYIPIEFDLARQRDQERLRQICRNPLYPNIP